VALANPSDVQVAAVFGPSLPVVRPTIVSVEAAFVVAVGVFDRFDLAIADEREKCGVGGRGIAAQDGARDELDAGAEGGGRDGRLVFGLWEWRAVGTDEGGIGSGSGR